MRIVDNFLDAEAFTLLHAALHASDFPWQTSRILSGAASLSLAPADNIQLVHGFYLNKPGAFHSSPQLPVLQALLVRLAPLALLKVKANRTVRRDRHIEYGLHVDTRKAGATTAIYYLNTNNGYTRFGDGRVVTSVANRIVLFDAALEHTGAACTDADERIVINLNLMLACGQ